MMRKYPCYECPYYGSDHCREVQSALKEYKPHVLSDTVELLAHDGAVLIEYNPHRLAMHPEWAFIDRIGDGSVYINRNSDHTQLLRYTLASYGITWRCWTGRPSDKQMEEVAWDELSEMREL